MILRAINLVLFILLLGTALTGVSAQSTKQDAPTPVTGNVITGEIRPRAVGDPRLTNYYYIFKGNQGDVFINVVSNNLDGDIDIFTAGKLDPLTKIPLFSGVSENETGRVIYLRKPAQLILRVQGRTPNDESATFQIKFAGSFVAMEAVETDNGPELPKIDLADRGAARVSPVGTIIEVFPRPEEEETANQAENTDRARSSDQPDAEVAVKKSITFSTLEKEPPVRDTTLIEIRKEASAETAENQTGAIDQDAPVDPVETGRGNEATGIERQGNVPRLVVTDKFENRDDRLPEEITESPRAATDEEGAKDMEKATETGSAVGPEAVQPVEPERLVNIKLVVLFKNKTKFRRSMDRITWFNVDRGILTIITDDATILKFSMLDIERMTFETDQ